MINVQVLMEWQEEEDLQEEEEDEEDHTWCVSKQKHRLKEETTTKKNSKKKAQDFSNLKRSSFQTNFTDYNSSQRQNCSELYTQLFSDLQNFMAVVRSILQSSYFTRVRLIKFVIWSLHILYCYKVVVLKKTCKLLSFSL